MWSISLVRGKKVKAKPVDTMFARLRPVFAMVGTIEPFNDHIWYLGFRCKVPTTGSWSPGSGTVCDGAFWEEGKKWVTGGGPWGFITWPHFLFILPFLSVHCGQFPSSSCCYDFPVMMECIPLNCEPLQTHSPLSCFLSCVWSQWWESNKSNSKLPVGMRFFSCTCRN